MDCDSVDEGSNPSNHPTLTLKGISSKGKNRISQWGSTWILLRFENRVSCLGNVSGMLVKSLPNDNDNFDLRWICVNSDPNFKIEA